MYKVKYMAIFTMAFFFLYSFIACSSDNDDNEKKETEIENPEDNRPDEAKAFIGYWRNSQEKSTKSNDFIFFSDGICERYTTYEGE